MLLFAVVISVVVVVVICILQFLHLQVIARSSMCVCVSE